MLKTCATYRYKKKRSSSVVALCSPTTYTKQISNNYKIYNKMPFGLRFYTFLWITLSNSWLPFIPTTPSTTSSSSSSTPSESASLSSTRGVFYHHSVMMGAEAQPSSLTEKIPLGKWKELKNQVLKSTTTTTALTVVVVVVHTHTPIHTYI